MITNKMYLGRELNYKTNTFYKQYCDNLFKLVILFNLCNSCDLYLNK